MIPAFAVEHRRLTLALLLAAAGLAIAAAAIGIDDNPPGLALAWLSSTAAVIAFVHPLRTPRAFRAVAYWSLGAFLLFGILHNLFSALAGLGSGGFYALVLTPLAVGTFFIALFPCPAGVAFGLGGVLLMGLRQRPGT